MTTLIQYNGEVVAVAGSQRFHLAPRIEALEPRDPLRAMVAMMCVFAQRIRGGELPGPYSDDRAELYARCALTDEEAFISAASGENDSEIPAARFDVQVAQIEAKRRDLGLPE